MTRPSALLLLAAAACAAPAPADVPRFVPPKPSAALRLHVFDTGSVSAPRGFVAEGQGWFSRRTLDMPAFVVEHPAGLVVFDTGLPAALAQDPVKVMGRLNHWLAPFRLSTQGDLPAQMSAAGLDPARVRWVVVSHRHFDHVGSLRAFPNAKVAVARRELDAALGKVKGDKNHSKPAVERFDGLAVEPVAFDGARPFGPFEASVDLLGDGSVVLLDASGHTAGSLAAWVAAGREGVLLTGDASWTEANWSLPARQYYAWDEDLHWRRLWQIREWKRAQPGLLVLCGHDLGPLRREASAGVFLHE